MSQRRSVALAGLMGTGKSTVGPLLAARLGVDFVDLDTVIEEEAGCSVAAIFAAESEAGFRRRESEALARLLARETPLVLALGGGTAHQPGAAGRIRRRMPVAVLWAPVEVLVARAGQGSSRPLAGRIRALAQERAPALARLGPRFSTDGTTPATIAQCIADWLEGLDELD